MTVLLLDGYNLLYRSFLTLPQSITGADNRPINAVYGLVSSILRFSRDLSASHIICAFDVPEVPTFRHTLYPAYQGQRGPMGGDQAEEFSRQVAIAREVLPQIGVPALDAPGFEADDVLGTMALRLAHIGSQAVIISTDRDLLQLVREHIEVCTPQNPPVHARTVEDVVARLGVIPSGVPTLKALAGDASDNVPGVAGIGTKTAVALVNAFATLDGIYGALDELPARTARLLESGREAAYVFLDVVTIRTDLEVALNVAELPDPGFTFETTVRGLLDPLGYGRPRPE